MIRWAAISRPCPCPWTAPRGGPRHPFPIAIPQWEIEEVLEERATAAGARILRGAAVTAVDAGRRRCGRDGGRPAVRGPLSGRRATAATARFASCSGCRSPAGPGRIRRCWPMSGCPPFRRWCRGRWGHMSELTRQAGRLLGHAGPYRRRALPAHLRAARTRRTPPATPRHRRGDRTALQAVYGPETVLARWTTPRGSPTRPGNWSTTGRAASCSRATPRTSTRRSAARA